jgi:mRNA-degrading endonuclease toxin of MazEF toxin-antitoxin module
MSLRRGQVIDVDLEPTKGSETGKVRPCIVVTNDGYNGCDLHLISLKGDRKTILVELIPELTPTSRR